jgi:hypothetical protein
MRILKGILFLITACVFLPKESYAQCGGTVPSYTIDMTGHPDSVWTSPSVSRNGLCCSASGSDRCIVFNVTLDPYAAAVKLDVVGGLGSTVYQVNCGSAVNLGSSTCITGGGTIKITLCKPGSNTQQYTVTSIPGGYASASSFYISKNCQTKMAVEHLLESSITWTALDTNYNYALSCRSGCDTTVVTADTTFPDYLDVQVCGTPSNPCAGTSFCDTLRVTFLQDLAVTLNPQSTYICPGTSTKNVKATATGGKRPYTYSWTGTTDTDSSIDVGAGTYIVTVRDAALCQVAKDTVVITAASLPTPSIGGNTTVCEDMSYTYSVTSVSGHSYSWSATNGTIIGSNTSNSVSVRWGTPTSGTVSISQTNNTTGCVGTNNKTVTISPAPVTTPIQH